MTAVGLALLPSPAAPAKWPREVGPPAPSVRSTRYPLSFDGVAGFVATGRLLGNRRLAYVDVSNGRLLARFGPWSVECDTDNVLGASVGGPYPLLNVIGPPRLSLADGGLTFATNVRQGVCIRFYNPVVGIEPSGRIRHPSLTVTVADCDALVSELASLRGHRWAQAR